jgi:hypothetical protein
MKRPFSELRKYRVGFTVAHQYLHQLEPDIRHAVLGNTGSIISFRVGAEDASYLVREFNERFGEIDLLQLPNYRIYLKLMIDGTPSRPFSAARLSQILAVEPNLAGDDAAGRVGDEPQDRERGDALAAAAFTDQGNDLTLIKIERGAIDCAHQALLGVEIDHEVAHAQERGHMLACPENGVTTEPHFGGRSSLFGERPMPPRA